MGILGGFAQNYIELSWKIILILASCCVALNIASKFWQYNSNTIDTSEPQDSTIDADRDASQGSTLVAASTLELMGEDSVYRFFLSKNWWGWSIALLTVAAQIGMCVIFVLGSRYDFRNSLSDLKYPWQCPPDLIGCRNTIGRSWRGWLAFYFLMVAHLMKDAIKGSKLIVISSNTQHLGMKKSCSVFFGGTVILLMSLFVLYTSIIYNNAIAVTDTDLIANAVIILFVTDLDEMMLSISVLINPNWCPKDSSQEVIKEDVKALKSEVLQLKGKMTKVESESVERKHCFESEISELRDTNKRYESEITHLRETLRDTNERSESEMNTLRETNRRLESKMSGFQSKMSELCEKVERMGEK